MLPTRNNAFPFPGWDCSKCCKTQVLQCVVLTGARPDQNVHSTNVLHHTSAFWSKQRTLTRNCCFCLSCAEPPRTERTGWVSGAWSRGVWLLLPGCWTDWPAMCGRPCTSRTFTASGTSSSSLRLIRWALVTSQCGIFCWTRKRNRSAANQSCEHFRPLGMRWSVLWPFLSVGWKAREPNNIYAWYVLNAVSVEKTDLSNSCSTAAISITPGPCNSQQVWQCVQMFTICFRATLAGVHSVRILRCQAGTSRTDARSDVLAQVVWRHGCSLHHLQSGRFQADWKRLLSLRPFHPSQICYVRETLPLISWSPVIDMSW